MREGGLVTSTTAPLSSPRHLTPPLPQRVYLTGLLCQSGCYQRGGRLLLTALRRTLVTSLLLYLTAPLVDHYLTAQTVGPSTSLLRPILSKARILLVCLFSHPSCLFVLRCTECMHAVRGKRQEASVGEEV